MSAARAGVAGPEPLPASLKTMLRRAQRRRKTLAVLLIAPLLLFLLVNFVLPVGLVLLRSVDDRAVAVVLTRTAPAIVDWRGDGVPGEAVFAAFHADLRDAQAARNVTILANRLNIEKAGFQALVTRTARVAAATQAGSSASSALIAIDARWGQRETWLAVRRAAAPFTAVYLLAAFDLTLDDEGSLVEVPEQRRLFKTVWLRTFWIAGVITLLCVVLGYPLAHFLASAPPRLANILMILVLLPFWTSLLVRTTAWVALLQTEGVVNDLALVVGLVSERTQMIRNRFGVYVTMTHVLLPYMVLPLYGVMKRVPPTYMRAASSLGANPLRAFLKIYLPLTLHGVGAGAALVFILAVGFYITPALVGGPNDQMISYYVAYYTNESLNWNGAAALSVCLLVFTAALFWMFNRLFGLDRLKIG